MLEVDGLTVEYRRRRGNRRQVVRALDNVSLSVGRGEILGVVGESGSGKSTLARTLIRLVNPSAGSIRFDGQELVGLSRRETRQVRSNIQLVFQNPLLSLSPRRRVGWQFEEPLKTHTDLDRVGRLDRIEEILDRLDLSPTVMERFPHEISGGQAQRVVLARALLLRPKMILFDEPTSALDVSVQAGVLNLLQRLRTEHDLTYMFITHDLAVARHLSDRVAVMQSGRVVECRPTATLFDDPQDPYTRQLLDSLVKL